MTGDGELETGIMPVRMTSAPSIPIALSGRLSLFGSRIARHALHDSCRVFVNKRAADFRLPVMDSNFVSRSFLRFSAGVLYPTQEQVRPVMPSVAHSRRKSEDSSLWNRQSRQR